MIKVYIDWNVMSNMKRGNFDDFKQLVLNKDKFLLMYSPSHVNDIFASLKSDEINDDQKEIINSDLNYITTLTNDLCIFNTPTNCTINHFNPHELFEDEFENKKLLTDFSIDNLLSHPLFDDNFKNFFKEITIDNIFKEALSNPQSEKALNILFPDLKENPTMDGVFKSFGKLFTNLNEKEGYKDLRDIVQKIGVNNGHFNPNKNPFEVIDKAYKKYNLTYPNPNEYLKRNNSGKEWFDKITDEFILLDIHGFNADKVQVDSKNKKTFRNTTEDGFHTAFASRTDFYITVDTRNIAKAKAVYQKLDIRTQILKPDEFVEYFKSHLDKYTFVEHFNHIFEILMQNENLELFDGTKVLGFVKFANEYFFDFFNKIYAPLDSESFGARILLSRNYPSTPSITLPIELEKLIKILTDSFGKDIDGKSYYSFDEMNEDEVWVIRDWIFSNNRFSLKRVQGHYQFYLFVV